MSANPGRIRPVLALLVVACVAAAAACKDGQRPASAPGEGRETTILLEVEAVLDGWIASMDRSVPADPAGLAQWHREARAFDWRTPTQAAVGKARGMPFEARALAAPIWLEALESLDAGKAGYADYRAAREKMKAESGSKAAALLAEFEDAFAGVEAFLGAGVLADADRPGYYSRHWQRAWDLARGRDEPIDDWLVRLCKARKIPVCTEAPFERLQEALERPYLQEVRRAADAFAKKHPERGLSRALSSVIPAIDARIASLPAIREDPVVPTSISRKAAPADAVVTVRKAGIDIGGRRVAELPPDEEGYEWRGLPADQELLRRNVARKVAEEAIGSKKLPTVRVDLDRQAPMRLLAWVRGTFERWPGYIAIGTRHRADGVNRPASLPRFYYGAAGTKQIVAEVDGRRWTCVGTFQTRGETDLLATLKDAVWLAPKRTLAGSIANLKATGLRPVEEEKAARDLRGAGGVVLVQARTSAERLVGLLEAVVLACKDPPVCMWVDELTPPVLVANCFAPSDVEDEPAGSPGGL
ncbi:MAG: hypothetical protein FJ087_02990 [Deltaproteobacteria bacterium]|nr:hypothetical protein [Deltaproteobacteria bacterium]